MKYRRGHRPANASRAGQFKTLPELARVTNNAVDFVSAHRAHERRGTGNSNPAPSSGESCANHGLRGDVRLVLIDRRCAPKSLSSCTPPGAASPRSSTRWRDPDHRLGDVDRHEAAVIADRCGQRHS